MAHHRTMMISSSSLSSASSSSSSSSSSSCTMPHKLSSGSTSGHGTCVCAGGANSLVCSSNSSSLCASLSSAVNNQANDSITINQHHPHNGSCNNSASLPLIPCSADCSYCWSSSSLVHSNHSTTPTQLNHHHHHHHNHQTASSTTSTIYSKSRTIRLRKSDPNISLGFSIRGGWEHGIGFYVSEVQPDSIAAKHGLCAGDQIIRINGFPLNRVIHEEVVALVRLSTTDLTLQVRSAGIVPLKSKPNEKLTWKRLCGNSKEGTEVNSFVYTRPRSSSLSITPSLTPTSSLEDTDEQLSDEPECPSEFESHSNHGSHHSHYSHSNHHSHPHHHSSQLQLHSNHQSSNSAAVASRAVYCSNYTEKHLYIRCHQAGSSLGCSVVNGPVSCPGIFVQHIKEGKLAQKCGLEIGDQIVKVNNVDVAAIGFDGAITMLKSLTNLSLLIRKGVARHIFECSSNSHEPYENLFGTKECHFNTIQYHCSKSQSSSTPSLVQNSLSTFMSPDSHSQINSGQPNHHHTHNPHSAHHLQPYSQYYQYKTIATGPQVPNDDLTTVANNNNNNNGHSSCSSQFCAAYSSVQISSTTGAPVVGSCSAGSVASASSSSSGLSSMSSCEKSRCCCKRQRTITTTQNNNNNNTDPLSSLLAANGNGSIPPPPQIISCSTAAAAGMCTLLVANNHNHHQVGGSDHLPQLFADSGNLDKVTSAMANSIRILQEVREKEEKLVEASRKLNEEHQKLCREKEKLENDKKELNERSSCLKENRPPPPMSEHHDHLSHMSSLNSQYSTASTVPISGTGGSASGHRSSTSPASNPSSSVGFRRSVITGPTFSFLEEIKALGIDGGKRHLKPVNSNNIDIGKGNSNDSSYDSNGNINKADNSNQTTTNNRTKPDKLRRSPFGLTNNVIKDVDKQRQHELLMEEFRIAHQRMFGGNARDDSGTVTGLARFKLNKVNNRTNKSMPNICANSVDDDDDNEPNNNDAAAANQVPKNGKKKHNDDHGDSDRQIAQSNHDPKGNNRKAPITSSGSKPSTKPPAPPVPTIDHSKDSSNQYHHQPLSRQPNYHHNHHQQQHNNRPATNKTMVSSDNGYNESSMNGNHHRQSHLHVDTTQSSSDSNHSRNKVVNSGNNRITIKVLSPKIVAPN